MLDAGDDAVIAEARGLEPMPVISYNRVAIGLHWAIAFCIACQLVLGWRLHGLEGAAKYDAYQLHKSIGLSILILSVGRLAWRWLHRSPREILLPRWQMMASSLVHGSLYVIMIGLPLSGWLMVSTSRIAVPTRLFGVVPWPMMPGTATLDPGARLIWNVVGDQGHLVLVWVTVALLLLHLGAVAKHQIVDRDRVFARMAPNAGPGLFDARFLLIAALAAVAVAIGWTVDGGLIALRAGTSKPVTHKTAAPRVRPPAMPVPAERGISVPEAPHIDDATRVPSRDAMPNPRAWMMRSGTLGFTATWAGDPVVGTFAKWTTAIVFAPDALDRSRIVVSVDLASVKTGDQQRDDALPSADWFDVSANRYAVFTSSRIRRIKGDSYVADGHLDLRGVGHSIAVPFTLRLTGDRAFASGALKIDRTAFGVGQGEWAATDQIAANVDLKFTLDAATSPPPAISAN